MSGDSKRRTLKSAYELALERLQAQGVEPPKDDAIPEEVKQAIAEVRRVVQAKLAELEILHQDRLRKVLDPRMRQQEEEAFARERQRIQEDAERKITKLKAGVSSTSSR